MKFTTLGVDNVSPDIKVPSSYVVEIDGRTLSPTPIAVNACIIEVLVIGTLLLPMVALVMVCSNISLPTDTRSFMSFIGESSEGIGITIYII